MMMFWAIASALMAAALWFVIPPLLASRRQSGQSRRDINLGLYRDKLAELEADKARGTLSPDQFDQARADLERQLLDDLRNDQSGIAPQARPRPRWLVQGLALALPMSAIAFYLGQASREGALDQAIATQPPAAGAASSPVPAVAAMAGKAMAGGAMIAAGAAKPGDEKKAMPMEEAIGRLRERLDKHPEDGDGWLLLGNSYRFLGKPEDAKAAFDKAAALGKQIPPATAAAATPTAAAMPSAAAAPDTAPAAGSAAIKGTVSIDSALAGEVKGDETVFIFARAVSGPPMPLAVLRKQARDLPLDFTLDDSLSLMPALKLSSAHEVVVGARISKTGNAIAAPGDLEGVSGTVAVGDGKPVRIVIDHRS